MRPFESFCATFGSLRRNYFLADEHVDIPASGADGTRGGLFNEVVSRTGRHPDDGLDRFTALIENRQDG